LNFVNSPELHWGLGYFYALALMAAISLALWYYFTRSLALICPIYHLYVSFHLCASIGGRYLIFLCQAEM